MPLPCSGYRSGYALLSFILITITLLVMIIIPLYGLSLINVRSTVTSQSTRQNFYVTESAIYDTVSKIVSNNFLWPAPPPVEIATPQTLAVVFNNITTTVSITRTTDLQYTIESLTNFKDTTRHLQAKLYPSSTGGVSSDVIIVMDTSGSMTFAGSSPQEPLTTAINAAKTLINELASQTDNTQIGLVEFNTTATLKQGLVPESNFNTVTTALNNLNSVGWTNIGHGFQLAREELNNHGRANANSYIVLLSDGVANRWEASAISCATEPKSHTDCTNSAINQALLASNEGHTVFTIGLNLDYYDSNPGSCTIPPCGARPVAYHTLLSAAGNERFFDSPDADDLEKIYEQIANEIIEAALFSLTELR